MRRGTGRVILISAMTTIVGSWIVRRSKVSIPGFSD